MKSNGTCQLLIVVPCYNEEKLRTSHFLAFLETNPQVKLCFVDDKSTDHTLAVLNRMKSESNGKISVLSLESNSGKAEAVRTGILHSIVHDRPNAIGYLDADLACSPEEWLRLSRLLKDNIVCVLGSRRQLSTNKISRNPMRHYIGRTIAFFIDRLVQLNIHDTQCGCKIFDASTASTFFAEPFATSWLFDVEILLRLKILLGSATKRSIVEVPLTQWIEQGDSSVPLSYAFKVWSDLWKIRKIYT